MRETEREEGGGRHRENVRHRERCREGEREREREREGEGGRERDSAWLANRPTLQYPVTAVPLLTWGGEGGGRGVLQAASDTSGRCVQTCVPRGQA